MKKKNREKKIKKRKESYFNTTIIITKARISKKRLANDHEGKNKYKKLLIEIC